MCVCTEKSRRLLSYFIAPQKNKNQYTYNENVNFFIFCDWHRISPIIYFSPGRYIRCLFCCYETYFFYTFLFYLFIFLFGSAVIGNITFPYTARHLDIPSRERRSLAALNSRSGMCVSLLSLSSCVLLLLFFLFSLRYTHTHLYRAT